MITNRPADRATPSALAVSGWPLRRKLALALTIPLLLAGTLGALRVRADLVAASNSSASARQVTALPPAVEYLTAAEKAMVTATGTGNAAEGALEDAFTALRAAGADLLAAKKSADLTADQRYQVDTLLDLSQALRAEDAVTLSPDTLVAQLRQLQSGVTQLITTIVKEQHTPQPRLELLSQALAGRFSLAMQQALAATDRSGDNASLELFSEFGAEGAAIERLAGALGAQEKSVASLRTANAQRFRTVRTGGSDLGGAGAYADYDRIISNLQDGIDDELAAAASEARTAAFLNAGITLAALLAAILLALLVARLLLKPIRRVREGALAVAHDRLPEAVARIRAGEEPGDITPIDVTSQEEIGQLARAVDDLHRQAVVLASGEASLRAQVSQMFVTLSRRSTSLVNQQLGLIERLERDEEDPQRLESLFRLDHLAARMRRTADSLLILADAPTAGAVTDELTVSEALQAATSGVQDYQRVRIGSASPAPLDRGAAADVIHLLTELVDNALTYSPPTSTVTVESRSAGDGVVIEIADAGLGIPAEQLARINADLASEAEITPDTARRMGLFVVSRLSRRHGIVTVLSVNEQGGTTATVLLTAAVLPGPAASDAVVGPGVAPAQAPVAVPVESAERPAEQNPSPRPKSAPIAQAQTFGPAPAPAQGMASRDIGSLINASLGLSTTPQAPASGAPAPVTAQTAAAALARVGPLRGDAVDPTSEAEAPVSPPVLRAVNGTAAAGDQAPRANGLPVRARATGPGPGEARATEAEDVRVDLAEPAVVPARDAAPGSAPEATLEPEPVTGEVRSLVLVPDPTPARPSAVDALGGDWTDPGDDGSDTPIFGSLRSAWLSSGEDAQPWRTSEIEAGWEKADEIADTPAAVEVTESGLPLRRPGSRLVPGGVTNAPTATVRDPEAVRARLAAHASGVSRGRAAAAANPSSMEAGS